MRTDVTSSGGAQCSRRNPSGIHFTKFLSVARHALAMLERTSLHWLAEALAG